MESPLKSTVELYQNSPYDTSSDTSGSGSKCPVVTYPELSKPSSYPGQITSTKLGSIRSSPSPPKIITGFLQAAGPKI